MARAFSLLIATIVAAVLMGLAAPSFASRAERQLRSSLPFLQADESVTCRSHDPALVQFDAELGADLSPGRVIVLDDGTLAVLIVSAEIDDAGRATAIDFAASLRISAIILRSEGISELRAFDPPVRNGANLRAQDGGPIDEVSFCYRVSFPAPPKAQEPGATAEPSPTSEVEPTSTELTLDVSAQETADARSVEIAATATAAAGAAATEVAVADARADEIAASATAAADAAAATTAAQQTAIASAEAEAAAAQATMAALQATLAAPTSTPTPEPTPSPVTTVVAYQTSGEDPFAGWDLPDGWQIENDLLTTDGGSGGSWLVVPAPSSLGTDMAVEIEFRVTGGDLCPRNFGVGVRMSESGYQAGGIEWACAPEAVIWSGAGPVAKRSLPEGIDLAEGWHTLSVSAIGEVVAIAIDGTEVAAETIPSESPGHLIAVWSDSVGLEIRAVSVYEAAP